MYLVLRNNNVNDYYRKERKAFINLQATRNHPENHYINLVFLGK